MSCQGKCKDCSHWKSTKGYSDAWARCDLAATRHGRYLHPDARLVAGGHLSGIQDCDLFTHESFGCNQFRECLGHTFVKLVEEAYRAVDEEYTDVARKPRGVAFAILTLLDGSGENQASETRYRVCVEKDGEWRPVEFAHHDLDSVR